PGDLYRAPFTHGDSLLLRICAHPGVQVEIPQARRAGSIHPCCEDSEEFRPAISVPLQRSLVEPTPRQSPLLPKIQSVESIGTNSESALATATDNLPKDSCPG